jgi:hypothetical protein
MKEFKFSELPRANLDAADFIIDTCITREDSTVGFDLGDGQVACFEIRDMEESYYLKEYLKTTDEEFVDEDTEGNYNTDQLIELIINRLSQLDLVTDYPRLSIAQQKELDDAIKAAKRVSLL